jgi:hypothetical protein
MGMDKIELRNAPTPEPESDDAASLFNPQPPGEADRLAFDPVPLRYRTDGLTPQKQRDYVEALADCGIVREAAARVGVSEQTINRVRRRCDARSFDSACEAAQVFGARRLRSIAFERAVEGTLKGHYYRGELVGQERVHDNRLLTYLLGKTEHLLAPPKESLAICDDWEAHMDSLEQGLPPPDLSPPAAVPGERARPEFTGYEVTEDECGIWWTSFPPPDDFDGEEQEEYGDFGYKRTLSPREQAIVDADLEQELEEERAAQADRRDRYFGFAGNVISSLMEAGTSEASEPSEQEDRGEAPIEYKSLVPPCHPPSFRRKPESMNTEVRGSHRPRSWIPDRVPDDDRGTTPGSAMRRTFPPARAFPR